MKTVNVCLFFDSSTFKILLPLNPINVLISPKTPGLCGKSITSVLP